VIVVFFLTVSGTPSLFSSASETIGEESGTVTDSSHRLKIEPLKRPLNVPDEFIYSSGQGDIGGGGNGIISHRFFGDSPEEWNRTYGGPQDEKGYGVKQTADGGYIIIGYVDTFGNGKGDALLIKTDSEGTMLWEKVFGGANNDRGQSVQQTNDGGYIIAGTTNSYGAGEYDMWLIKTDCNGSEEWNRTFGGPDSDIGYSAQQTMDGGYVINGETYSTDTDPGNWNMWLVKTDEVGIEQWNRTFGGTGDELCYSGQQTADGGYVLAGGRGTFNRSFDFLLVKTDENGVEQWNRSFGGNDPELGSSVQQALDGGYVIVGDVLHDYFDIWLVKTDENGVEQWNRTFGIVGPYGGGDDWGRSVQQTTDGGYIIAGSTDFGGHLTSRAYLVKTDSEGNLQWDLDLGGNHGGSGKCAEQTTDGGYILTGSIDYGNKDVWLVKVRNISSPWLEISDIEDGWGVYLEVQNKGDARAVNVYCSIKYENVTLWLRPGTITNATWLEIASNTGKKFGYEGIGFGGFFRPATLVIRADAENTDPVTVRIPMKAFLVYVFLKQQ
jgi:hypothetical protein